MKTFRLVRSPCSSASYNMSLDEAIFARYLKDAIPVFRVYRWSAPSFTYGVSQKPEADIDVKRCERDGIGLAGRMTGGGVLFHNDEITYSFVCDKTDVGEPKSALVSYREICAFLIRFYKAIGLNASFACEVPGFSDKNTPHELCSASHEKYDIVINGKKIGGNAQKRTRQAIFQHGSVPCSIDWVLMNRYIKDMPDDLSSSVTTLSGELANVPDKNILEQKLIDAFGETFGVCFKEEDGSLYEAGMA